MAGFTEREGAYRPRRISRQKGFSRFRIDSREPRGCCGDCNSSVRALAYDCRKRRVAHISAKRKGTNFYTCYVGAPHLDFEMWVCRMPGLPLSCASRKSQNVSQGNSYLILKTGDGRAIVTGLMVCRLPLRSSPHGSMSRRCSRYFMIDAAYLHSANPHLKSRCGAPTYEVTCRMWATLQAFYGGERRVQTRVVGA